MHASLYVILLIYLAANLNTFGFGVSHMWSFTCGWVSAIAIVSVLLFIYKGLGR